MMRNDPTRNKTTTAQKAILLAFGVLLVLLFEGALRLAGVAAAADAGAGAVALDGFGV